jgi:hypothetical protein
MRWDKKGWKNEYISKNGRIYLKASETILSQCIVSNVLSAVILKEV